MMVMMMIVMVMMKKKKMVMTTLSPTSDFSRSVRSVCAILVNYELLRKSTLKRQKQKKKKTNT